MTGSGLGSVLGFGTNESVVARLICGVDPFVVVGIFEGSPKNEVLAVGRDAVFVSAGGVGGRGVGFAE